MATDLDDFDIGVSTYPPPSAVLRDVDVPDYPDNADDLTLRIVRLVALHPGVVKFRMKDLPAMDDQTKRMLLADICRALGIS